MIPSVILVIVLVAVILYLLFSQLGEGESKQYRRYDKYDERKSFGEQGEIQAQQTLEWYLPEGYTIISNIIIIYDDGKSEIDNVVVGKTGVFVIEVKSLKGVVIGDCNDYDWVHYKEDAYGNEFHETFYSPVKQVGTHVWRLANYLKKNHIRTWVKKAVYFTVPDTEYHFTNVTEECPVFTYKTTDKLINYILSGEENLSENTVNKIKNLLQ